jgi:hypothetical protein
VPEEGRGNLVTHPMQRLFPSPFVNHKEVISYIGGEKK